MLILNFNLFPYIRVQPQTKARRENLAGVCYFRALFYFAVPVLRFLISFLPFPLLLTSFLPPTAAALDFLCACG
jgi:hypothetical protein